MRRALAIFWLLSGCGGRLLVAPQLDAATSDAALPTALDLATTPAADLADADLANAPLPDLATTADLAVPDGTCPAGMVTFATFCMDRYEAPNQEGASPFAFQTAADGETWCHANGQKRVCTEDEWVSACRGAANTDYPYGATYHKSWCNDDKTWIAPNWTTLGTYPSQASKDEAARLYQADPSGSRTMCISNEGVYDLTGNVAEWVKRSQPHPPNNYDYVVKGCYWSGCYGGSPPSCSFTNPAHPPQFRSYEFGFRCCKDR